MLYFSRTIGVPVCMDDLVMASKYVNFKLDEVGACFSDLTIEIGCGLLGFRALSVLVNPFMRDYFFSYIFSNVDYFAQMGVFSSPEQMMYFTLLTSRMFYATFDCNQKVEIVRSFCQVFSPFILDSFCPLLSNLASKNLVCSIENISFLDGGNFAVYPKNLKPSLNLIDSFSLMRNPAKAVMGVGPSSLMYSDSSILGPINLTLASIKDNF